MKHPILLNLKKRYPSLEKRERAPANSMYHISFAKKTWWKNDDISIIQQDYDAKDAYLSLIEINTKIPLQLTISCIQADLYWFYQLSGTTQFFIPDNIKAGPFSVNSQEYTLMYASQRNYEVHIDTGSHLLFFFVVKADWLFRKT